MTKPGRIASSGDQPDFPPLDHSVYLGRERLGRYLRIGKRLYAAYDAGDLHLGNFKSRQAAYRSVTDAARALDCVRAAA